MDYYSAIYKKKEQNNGICSNIDGRRDYFYLFFFWDFHTEWSKSEKDNWYHSYVESNFKKQ